MLPPRTDRWTLLKTERYRETAIENYITGCKFVNLHVHHHAAYVVVDKSPERCK